MQVIFLLTQNKKDNNTFKGRIKETKYKVITIILLCIIKKKDVIIPLNFEMSNGPL
jgi:hypothetical protein